jgi:MoaA/NifB/PqqE/SkfB family radical SAM enzyme
MLLSAANRQYVLDQQVELLSISFAGACPDTHERLRRNTRFEILARNIAALQALKASRGTKLPTLEMHFLMTRANLAELPAFVRLAAELGADEAVATNLTNTPTLEQEAQRVFALRPDPADLEIVQQASQIAEQAGLPFNAYPLEMQDQVLVCDANPLETIYINQLGEVAPCVNLGMCARDAIPRYFHGEPLPTPRLNFGDVRQGLPAALESVQRQAFCQSFRQRNVTAHPLRAFSALSGVAADEELPLPPEPCRACYKMYGV